MKKLLLTLFAAFAIGNIFAQQLVQTVLRNAKKKNVIGETFLGVQSTIPLSLDKVVGVGGKTTFPATYAYADYGVFENYTIGAMLGYTANRSTVTNSEYNVLSIAQQILCDTDPTTAAALGIQCNKTNETAAVSTSFALLGLRGQYHVQAGKRANMYGCLTVGYKAGTFKSAGASTTSPILNSVVNTYNKASKIFGSTVLGIHYYTDKKNTFAITGEAGMGYGWGDNIVIGTKTLMLNLGVTYRVPRVQKGTKMFAK